MCLPICSMRRLYYIEWVKDPVVQAGDPVLRATASPVPTKDIGSRKLATLIKKMSATLKREGFGVAIAAPQVGEPLRLFVVAGKVFAQEGEEKAPPPPDRVFINPEIIRTSKSKKEMSEGCLSVRNKYGSVLRHEKATVRASNEKGEEFTYHGTGLLAQIFQHEVDHLNGILYTDKALQLEEDTDPEAIRAKVRGKIE